MIRIDDAISPAYRFINETRGEESGTVGQNLSNLFGANWAFITDPRHMRGFDVTAYADSKPQRAATQTTC